VDKEQKDVLRKPDTPLLDPYVWLLHEECLEHCSCRSFWVLPLKAAEPSQQPIQWNSISPERGFVDEPWQSPTKGLYLNHRPPFLTDPRSTPRHGRARIRAEERQLHWPTSVVGPGLNRMRPC